jgi:drug/metabolite transporter (DMT)-like permease
VAYRNLLSFVLLAAVWGSAFVGIKAGLDFFPPVLFAAFRFDVASVLMLGYAAYAADRFRPRTAGEWWLVAVGSVFLIAGYHALLFVGEQGTTSAAAAVIVSLSPVLTTAFARGLLPDERLTLAGLVGMALGFVGVVVLAQPDFENLLAGDLLAEGFVLAAAVAFALGSVLTRRSESRLPVETLEAWSMLGGALWLHAGSLAIGESPAAVRWTAEAAGALAYLAVVPSAVGFLLYFYLLDRLGPIEINLVSYVAPIFAALIGFALLGEVVDAATVVGFAIVCSGFALLKHRAIAAEWPHIRAVLGGSGR